MLETARKRLTVLCAAFVGAAPIAAQTTPTSSGQAVAAAPDLDAFFRAQLDSFGIVGLGAAIIRDGRVAWRGGYGHGDLEKGTAVTPAMLFNIGSISKTVTLAALMHLWERGRFGLDDDINGYLPFSVRNPRYPDTPITFRMLLTHSSTISDMRPGEGTLPALHANRDPELPLEDVLRGFLLPGGTYYTEQNYNQTVPGTRYEYSNLSFSVIGYIIERLSGVPFPTYCREFLFEPLRMKQSTWRLAELKDDQLAFRYGRDESGQNRTRYRPTSWPGYMDGGLFTSIDEFGNFLVMMAGHGAFEGTQVLRPATMDTLLALQTMGENPPGRALPTVGHALLWTLSRAGPYEVYQMNGFGPSFFAQVYFEPKSGIAGEFFTTGQFSSMTALGEFVGRTFERLLAEAPRLTVAGAPTPAAGHGRVRRER